MPKTLKHTVHGEAVEGNDAVGRVVDHEFVDSQLATQIGFGRTGAAVVKVLKHHRVASERQQDLQWHTTYVRTSSITPSIKSVIGLAVYSFTIHVYVQGILM